MGTLSADCYTRITTGARADCGTCRSALSAHNAHTWRASLGDTAVREKAWNAGRGLQIRPHQTGITKSRLPVWAGTQNMVLARTPRAGRGLWHDDSG